MRTKLLAIGLVLGVGLAPSGCNKKEKKADDKVEPAPADPTPTDPAGGKVHGSGTGGGMGSGAGSGAQEMTNKMMHCPSAVEGSTTKVQLNKGAVVVTVTATDAAKVAEIQKRSKHLGSLASATAGPEVKHTGQGTGGGALGKCPAMIKDATLAVEDQKDGSKIVMTAKDPGKLNEIAKTAQDRADALVAAKPAGGEEGEDDEAADEE